MTSKKKTTRTRYSHEYKDNAVALCERIGVAAASRELGVNESQLYDWRQRWRADDEQRESEQTLAQENARLKRELAERDEEVEILKKASAYFAKSLK